MLVGIIIVSIYISIYNFMVMLTPWCTDEVACNFVPECVVGGGLEAWCHSLPWTGDDITTHDDWTQLDQFNTPQPSVSPCVCVPPHTHRPHTQERCNEDTLTPSTPPPPHKHSYTVYTDIKVVQSYLTIPEFKMASCVEDADILWLAEHFKQFK